MSERELDDIVSDLLTAVIERVQSVYEDKADLLRMCAPAEVGNLAMGIAVWALREAAPIWLPELGRPAPGRGAALSSRDRLALALLAARSIETPKLVPEVRADLAALRRMGRIT